MLYIDALKPVPPGGKPSDSSGTGGENPFDQRDVGRLVGVDARLGIGHRHDLCLQPKAASGARDALVDGDEPQHDREQQRGAKGGHDLQPLLAVALDPAPTLQQRQPPPPAPAEPIGPRPPAAAQFEPGALTSDEHTSDLPSLL